MRETTKLERMVGESFLYHGNQIKIKDYYKEEENNSIRIITQTEPILIANSKIQEFVSDCLPIEESKSLSIVSESQATITSLKDILMDNIKKVQGDKDYINQAKTINNSVNTLITMVSLQVKINSKS